MRKRGSIKSLAAALLLAMLAACATPPPPQPTRVAAAPQLAFEQKMGWILRLEEDRVLQLPEPPAPPPTPVVPVRGRAPAVVVPPPPRPSLLTLLADGEARIRRRAALAVGRTRLAAGVSALIPVLASDADPEVRQMAAFALGLIGDARAADALTAALADHDPLVQGRAAEGLGLLAHKPAASAIAAMMQTHVTSGVLDGIAADDLEHPKPAPVEAVRLGMFALVRLNAYDALSSVLLDTSGRPISRWWPVAYALRRVNDPRAGAPLLFLLQQGDGVFTRAFAARGLGVIKEPRAVEPLVATLANEREVVNVRVEAIRSLTELGAAQAVAPLIAIAEAKASDPNLKLEAVTALGQLRATAAIDLLIEVITDPWPTLRAAAFIALARVDPDTLLSAVSGLDADRHWAVRAALATALGSIDAERGRPRLVEMLGDPDQRVVPAVLSALVATGWTGAEVALAERLKAEDPVVRRSAAQNLVRLKSRARVAALIEAYDRAEKDPTSVARSAILAAVVELGGESARPLLERALGDHDWAMRLRAAALLRTIDPAADVADRIRPAPPLGPPELNELEPMINPTVSPVAYIDTVKGLIAIELAVLDAPRAVANFISLARRNFLGGTQFHRIVANFVAQDGDPRGDGEGGPAYTIRDEINQRPYLRGTVGMALEWEDTGGSQFFITHAPQPHLDGRYTVFGRVVQGMDVVDRLQQWDQIRTVRIWDGVSWIGPQ